MPRARKSRRAVVNGIITDNECSHADTCALFAGTVTEVDRHSFTLLLDPKDDQGSPAQRVWDQMPLALARSSTQTLFVRGLTNIVDTDEGSLYALVYLLTYSHPY